MGLKEYEKLLVERDWCGFGGWKRSVITNFLGDVREWKDILLLRKSESSKVRFVFDQFVRKVFDVDVSFFLLVVTGKCPVDSAKVAWIEFTERTGFNCSGWFNSKLLFMGWH